ncbi:UPF0489 family protein [Verrucomicrobia bacterium]|nr:UPF0489 family protein [Verrucomicrobiota bacterium]
MQRVLDIDLDFFLNRIYYCQDEPQGRLDPAEYQVDSTEVVMAYLRDRCGLDEENPIPGVACEHHVEVFDHWEQMVEDGVLIPPFEVVHVDAHADMGLGNLSCLYIAEEMLIAPLEERIVPGGRDPWSLNNCNFILFALAMGWIGKLTYVRHPDCIDDIQWMHMKDFSTTSGYVQMKRFEPGFADDLKDFMEVKKLPFTADPEIPMEVVSRDDFIATEVPDFLFITQSPNYTPETIDPVFEKAKRFVG